jgi:hypothetical protein
VTTLRLRGQFSVTAFVEAQMSKHLLRLATAFAVSLALCSGLSAAPVTRADLAGRTICMSNGDRNTFHASGKLNSNRFGRGAWAIALGGVQINAQYKIGLLPLSRRRDGTFLIKYTYGHLGSPLIVTGRYCG